MRDVDSTFDLQVKLAVYRAFATSGAAPSSRSVAAALNSDPDQVRAAYLRLRAQRVLVLESDGERIRMAPPFSGVPTQHRVEADGVHYFANCAWDALGIPAALAKEALVLSRCEQSRQALELRVTAQGIEQSDWCFHCSVPASHWWDDIVFT